MYRTLCCILLICSVGVASCAPTPPGRSGSDGDEFIASTDQGQVDASSDQGTTSDVQQTEEIEQPWSCESDADCDDKNSCTDNLCGLDGDCVYSPVSGICDDGNLCTLGDSCTGGLCAGSFKFCDDGNYCTDDFCEPQNGECQHLPNESDCEDGSACTVEDYCDNGGCVAGLEKPCTDDNYCTADSCDAVTGECSHEVIEDGEACDNDDPCTQGDVCLSGDCVAGEGVLCDDGNECTSEECISDQGGCVFINLDLPCEDGDLCTEDELCKNGQCGSGTAVVCADDNECTDDVCDPFAGVCSFVKNAASCDDGNPCTASDYCSDTVCNAGKGNACDDGNECTDDLCDGQSGECTYQNNLSLCEDGDLCTLNDICEEGACISGSAKLCDDTNLCTTDSCYKWTGECLFENTEEPCDDGDLCTLDDQCTDGACLSGALMNCDDDDPCTSGEYCTEGNCVQPGLAMDCNDDDECTTEVCISEEGGCIYTNLANDTPCFLSWCVESACKEGVCSSDQSPDCDDGISCTVDQCIEGQGCSNLPLDCNDGLECTSESCNEVTGECDYVTDDVVCDDGIECSINQCVVGQGCVDDFPEGCCGVGIDEGFESGNSSGWTFYASSNVSKWQMVTNGEAKTGAGALYYGNSIVWNYSDGANNGSALSPSFVVPDTPQAKLTFSVWIYIESSSSFDKLSLRLQPLDIELWSKAGLLQQTWVDVSVPLQNYAGQSIQLEWNFDTVDTLYNSTKGIFVDDVKVSACDNQ